MVVLGVSVYPDIRPLEEIRGYLELASRYGFTRVFTSMFSVEGTPQEVLACFKQLNADAHACGMEVSLDINPECMERLQASPGDLSVFAGIDADILRMDGAYGEDDNFLMLNNPYGIKIEYNASALDPASIEALVARGVDRSRMLACHNFYPQRYTGFRWDRFCEVNRRISRLDLRIGAFIASHAPETHGVWDAVCGLPTVERLRDYPADLQARILVAAGTTDVFFGNAYASEEELAAVAQAVARKEPHYLNEQHRKTVETLSQFAGEGRLCLRQHKVRLEPLYDLLPVEREILFEFGPHLDMGDSSEWIWRTRMPRLFYQDRAIPARPYAGAEFPRGSVVMVNDSYKHYAGEVQVVLEPILNDGTRNLVARINEQEMTLFDVIGEGDELVFMPQR
ncbi:MAG: MupG family TIM beta-alpha barrel fold protein [Coriobacteriales bacterium]|nr:MupG family TIM beta-alpha barrel fold protein [Coriobacteriales bacterium]